MVQRSTHTAADLSFIELVSAAVKRTFSSRVLGGTKTERSLGAPATPAEIQIRVIGALTGFLKRSQPVWSLVFVYDHQASRYPWTLAVKPLLNTQVALRY